MQLPIEFPAGVIRMAYHHLPTEGRVIIANVRNVTYHKSRENVTFLNTEGKVVKPAHDDTGKIVFRYGYVVALDREVPKPMCVFIYMVGFRENAEIKD